MAASAGESIAATAGETAFTMGEAARGTASKVMQLLSDPKLQEMEERLRAIPKESVTQVANIVSSKIVTSLQLVLVQRQLEIHLVAGLVVGLLLPWVGMVYCPFFGTKREAWYALGFSFGSSSTLVSTVCILARESKLFNFSMASVGIVDPGYAVCVYIALVMVASSAVALLIAAGAEEQRGPKEEQRGPKRVGASESCSVQELLSKLQAMDHSQKQLVAKVMEQVGLIETKLEALTSEMQRLQSENTTKNSNENSNEGSEDGIKTPPESPGSQGSRLLRQSSEEIDELYCAQYVVLNADTDARDSDGGGGTS
jgi:hypothetical protein